MRRSSRASLGCLVALAGCVSSGGEDARVVLDAHARDAPFVSGDVSSDAVLDAPSDDAGASDPWARGPALGARRHASGDLEVRLRAPGATRVELCLFVHASGEPETLRLPLTRDGDRFTLRVPTATLRDASLGQGGAPLYYGYRVWGPNWPFDPAWTPGSELGLVSEVDADGFRMNPNKLLFDPYALELSHDPKGPEHPSGSGYGGGSSRAIDTAPFAPKGIVIDVPALARPGPARAMRDEVVYEAHLRGLTYADESLGDARGTYEGARARARSLRALGVTAIELLPLHETGNDQNELTPDASGDNYWGYSTLSYFAPDRRFARDRSAGGPTAELRATIEAFHDEGLEVWLDVVYNHTAEGGGQYHSLRGISSPTYYELDRARTGYVNGNGVGPNLNTANEVTADLVLDSLRYWHEILGVDGFRFDLAPIVANGCERECYRFDRALPERIARELPARAPDGGEGVILVAEPWGLAAGSYQLGHFPDGWSEWNDRYRDAIRRDLNRLDVEVVTVRELAHRLEGSGDLFGARAPSASVNFVVAHDGFTLHDLFAYDAKQNEQPWPYGPSSGGSDANLSWSWGGDAVRQRAAARTAMALLGLSAGVPMIVAGDEDLRSQRGNNNAYNLDSVASWLAPPDPAGPSAFHVFVSRLFAFRAMHPALCPSRAWPTAEDPDGDGQPTLRWLRESGAPMDDAYFDATDRHFVGLELDGDELGDPSSAIYVAYNGWSRTLTVTPPAPPAGTQWAIAIDTSAAAESWSNARAAGDEVELAAATIDVVNRAVVVLIAR
ncbi:MAG: glycogen-debranching protein [Sandaracinaceae bacterium]|nr:glycogen-debranching protein [Sandaracinaceae bacterium]